VNTVSAHLGKQNPLSLPDMPKEILQNSMT
jgi:hypothetical protein